MVMVRNIDFASTCEATLLPFHGTCHLAYLPRDGHVLGLSKLARICKVFARRLQNQQRFTDQVLEGLTSVIGALGAAVVVQARHLADGPTAVPRVTFATSGTYSQKGAPCWLEFLTLLRLHGVSVKSLQPSPNGTAATPAAPVNKRLLVADPVKAVSSSEDLSTLLRVSDSMVQAHSEDSDETLMVDDVPQGGDKRDDPDTSSSSPSFLNALSRCRCSVGAGAGACGRTCRVNGARMAESVKKLLREMGENPDRQVSDDMCCIYM